MHIVLHTGVHFTDEDKLMKCLLRNAPDFAKLGVAVPDPGRYRTLLRDTLHAIGPQTPPTDNAREFLLDAFLDGETPDRMILSNEHFFCVPSMAVTRGVLYRKADQRVQTVRNLFSKDSFEVFMAIRNPATFLPAIFNTRKKDDLADFLGDSDPADILWSEVILRMREANPDVPMTIWCNEDTPLLWGQLIRDFAALEPGTQIKGGFDLLSEIMSREGMQRFRAYLAEQPEMNEIQRRRVTSAFLDKFAIEDQIEEVIDLPGWSEDLMDELTEVYEEDLFTISRIPGVTLMTP